MFTRAWPRTRQPPIDPPIDAGLAPAAPRPAPQSERAYAVLRVERMNARMAGVRAKRAAEAAQAEKDA